MLGKPFDKPFIFLYALSYAFLVICLVSAYYLETVSPQASRLETYGAIYLAMLTLAWAFMTGIKPAANIATATAIGYFTLVAVGFTGAFLGQRTIVGVPTFQILQPIITLTLIFNVPSATAEECFFRISLFHMLEPVIGTKWAAVTQAILFGIFHYYAYHMSLIGMATAIIAGLALEAIYLKFESQFAISLAHVAYNWTCVLIGAV